MKNDPFILRVKNMVCNRCIKVVKESLENTNVEYINVELGKIYLESPVHKEDLKRIENVLAKEGFELLKNKEVKIIDQIKSLIIKHIYYDIRKPNNENFSDYLASNIKMEYTQLSKLFSQIEKRSIENYIIQQKVERVKELLTYDELTISEISYELDYSSPQHLSRQFKQVTGLTPTEFKKIGTRKKIDTI